MPFAPLISVVNLYDSPIPPSIFSCPLDNVIFVRSLCVNESGLIWMWRYEQLVVVHFLWIRIYGCRCDVRQTPSRAVSLLPKGSEKVIPGTWYEYSHRTCLLCLQCVHVVSDEMWAGAASSPGPGWQPNTVSVSPKPAVQSGGRPQLLLHRLASYWSVGANTGLWLVSATPVWPLSGWYC